MNIGIVGFGRFGQLWAQALVGFADIKVYDAKQIPKVNAKLIKVTSLEEVAQADIIFLLVPISEFETCCQQIKPFVKHDSLLVDCCSVKIYPLAIMQRIFGSQQSLLATHPLFGPDSVQKSGGFKNHKIVICHSQDDDTKKNLLLDWFKKLGLIILQTTPAEHDKQMASSQGLVHFIGRGLSAVHLDSQELATPDFEALLNINHMVMHDSWRLFLDMHQYNPYTKEIRQKLIAQLITVDEEINRGK